MLLFACHFTNNYVLVKVKFDFFLPLKKINFRGTKNYMIESSMDGNGWSLVKQDTLDDDSDLQSNCNVPMVTITWNEYVKARFVRFTALSYYGEGASLQFLSIV